MSMSATLTLRGLVNYKPDLFDNMVLPTPPSYTDLGVLPSQVREAWTINKPDLVDFLCFQTEGMSLAIPDYVYLKKAIATWSKAHIQEWQRMFDTLFYKYNPLWNKDFTVTEREETNRDKTDNEGTAGTVESGGNVTDYTHGYDGGNSTEHDPMAPSTTVANIQWTHSDKRISDTSATTSGRRNLTVNDDTVRELTTSEKGNIGVTMVQEMITAERELALYNFEEFLADEFKKNFCIALW